MSDDESSRLRAYLDEKRELLREEYISGLDGVYGEDE